MSYAGRRESHAGGLKTKVFFFMICVTISDARLAGLAGGDKTETFFEAIRSETIKTLHWSLRHGGLSPTKPYHSETCLPPIHLAVALQKLRSLKCMLDLLDRKRDCSAVVDFNPDDLDKMTPLMLACKLDWKDGVSELIRNEASLTRTDAHGMTATQYAEKAKATSVLLFLEERLRVDTGSEVETDAMRRKRDDIEKSKTRRAEMESAVEKANISAKADRIEARFDRKARQQEAAALSVWSEVGFALEDMSTECKIDKSGDDPSEAPKDIDPMLWDCLTLKILRIRMPKGHLTSLPSRLGLLTNLTELIIPHNSLTVLPTAIGKLVNLKAIEAEANCLESLPEEIGNCVALEVVNVTANLLSTLAPLTTLSSIRSLLASHNALTDLEIGLETKSAIQVLSVGHNRLAALPAGLGALRMMKELDASHNLLEDLPAEMGALSEKKLLSMHLEGNNFKDRKIKQILEKSVKPVKELTNHIRSRIRGGNGKRKGKKKK